MQSNPCAIVAPVLLSQKNCLAAIGMTPRRYLETIRALKIPCVTDGALRLTEPAVFVAALKVARPTPEPVDAADALRRRIGKRRS